MLKKLDIQEGEKDKLFADYVIQVCEAHNRVIVSFLQHVQGGTRPTTEGSRENIGHNVHLWRLREDHTLVKRQSWGLSNNGGLRMVNWESQSPPPESRRRTHLLYFTYSYCILSLVWKLATSLLVFTILWTSISIMYVKTARDVVTVLLIFAKNLSLYLHIFTCTYRGTHTQAHMYNQHTRGMATTRHRSPVERGGKKALLETLHKHTKKKKQQKKCQENPDIHESQGKIRAHRASSKVTRLFLTK